MTTVLMVTAAVLVALSPALVRPRRAAAAAYDPDPYCQFHVLGSLFGDASGNGTANGVGWDPYNTNWRLSNSNAAVIGRFERCARLMVANDIGANGGATVTRRNNAVTLVDFWPAGRSVPFHHDAMTELVANATATEKRAFLMSVIEGEGEVCDPANGACPTAQIADNSRTTSGGTNPDFAEHILTLVPVAVAAGLVSAFTAAAQGCVPRTQAELIAGSGAALCIRSSDYPVIRDWPVASCKRVPGYGTLAGYACGQPDAAPGGSTATTAVTNPTTIPPPGSTPAFLTSGFAPDPIPSGGPGALSWTTVGMDPDRCKVRTEGEALATGLPTNMTAWPLPATRIRDGAVFTIVCFAGDTKFTAAVTIRVG